ncbi:hypothetical protein M5D96_002118 [Drosophila gunungcola]|uniref:Uncharacterized protein n=1 Tax=Drosophila gunungcola TaxID=103775 RepID=A0A9P9YZE9_9MUSC|nr:hypothetical protein M5D96_002118 [Drosophila gunungcola]
MALAPKESPNIWWTMDDGRWSMGSRESVAFESLKSSQDESKFLASYMVYMLWCVYSLAQEKSERFVIHSYLNLYSNLYSNLY